MRFNLQEQLDRLVVKLKAKFPRAEKARRELVKVKEPLTYQRGDGRSYFRDLALQAIGMADNDATDRLHRHAQDVRDNPLLNQTRLDGVGGAYVPPLWLLEDMEKWLAAAHPYVNLIPQHRLPAGTDSINLPKVVTNAPRSERESDDSSLYAPVRTLAGQQGVAVKLLNQSPIAFDAVLGRDLAAYYGHVMDVQVISGIGKQNQVLGVRNVEGIHRLTAANGSSSALYKEIGDAILAIHRTRLAPPEVTVMHPRRWAQFMRDVQGDPFGDSQSIAAGPSATKKLLNADGVVGMLHGVPVVCDPNMPSGDEDVVHVLTASDLMLFKSGLRARILPEQHGQTVLIQLFGYAAFSGERYPQGIAEITAPVASK